MGAPIKPVAPISAMFIKDSWWIENKVKEPLV
jgi:hypothetical protein